MSKDAPNGKVSNIELEMAIDEMKRYLPYQIQMFILNSKALKARFDALKGEGFTDEQSIEIVKARGTDL